MMDRADNALSAAGGGWPRAGVVIMLALIALATCVAYAPALSGEMLWDDNAHIPRYELRSLEGLYRIWFDVSITRHYCATQQWYPLLFSSFWLQYQLWGDAMIGYHLVNLALHLGAVFLVYAVLRKLQIPGAILAAGLFALHPVHVETVAWVTEQKNTQSAVFYLAAMLAYLHFDTTRRGGWYALALVLFVAALLSKTVTVTLPPALLVIFWWQRGRLSLVKDVLPLLPFFALALADGVVTMLVEQYVIGAEGRDFDLTFVEGLLLSGRALWFYLEKLVWPANLTFVYPRWELDPSDWRQWLYPFSFAALLAGLWSIRRRTRAPSAAILFFAGTLFPVLGFLNVFFFRYSFVSDHFPYLASLGVLALIAGGAALALERLPPASRWPGYALCAAVLATFTWLSWQQSAVYTNNETLYRTTLARNPQCWMIYHNLGTMLTDKNLPESLELLEKALQIRPAYPDALNSYGRALVRASRLEEGAEKIKEALRLKPDFTPALLNYGALLFVLGQPEEALAQYREAVRVSPEMAEAHYNLANALVKANDTAAAIQHYQEALRLKPDLAAAHTNLASTLLALGRREEGLAHLQQALQLQPDAETHYNLAMMLVGMNRPADALPHFEQSIQLLPNNPNAWANLAATYRRVAQPAKALGAAHKALDIARAQRQAALAAQLEAWIAEYQREQAGAAPASNPPTPPAPALPPVNP